jgi:hypothetical protein
MLSIYTKAEERDTLYYFEPQNLVNSLREQILSITDYGIYFDIDSTWSSYDLEEIHLLFTSDSTISINLPISTTFFVRETQLDTTPPDPYDRKSDLGEIPGSIIDSVIFTMEDSSDLYPNWLVADFSGDSGFQSLTGNIWLTSPHMAFTTYDPIPPISSSNYFQELFIWWIPENVDMAVKIVVKRNILDSQGNISVPHEFNLFQNHPNPFNMATAFKYEVGQDSFVRLEVRDILGELVSTLINNWQSRGIYTIDWDGKNHDGIELSSGIYLITYQYSNQLTSGLLSKKLVLLK